MSENTEGGKNQFRNLLIVGCFGCLAAIAGAVCTGLFMLLNAGFEKKLASLPTASPQPTLHIVPTIGAQLDFSPQLAQDEKLEDVLQDLRYRHTPFLGIYVSEMFIYYRPSSYLVYYKNGEVVPAESQVCLINNSYPDYLRSPLNNKVSESRIQVTVFTDYRYAYIIKNIEILSNRHEDLQGEIDYVRVRDPGGGGGRDFPYISVQTDQIEVAPASQMDYKITFTPFTLQPNQGVNIIIPVLFQGDGAFSIQVKINGEGLPEYSGDSDGDLTITTGEFNYAWKLLNDPRDFRVISLSPEIGATEQPANLKPCP